MKIMIPAINVDIRNKIEDVKYLILNEVNVKNLEFIEDTTDNMIVSKKIKPNYKTLGKIYGKHMKEIAEAIAAFSQYDIANIEKTGISTLTLADGNQIKLSREDVEISSEDIPGWLVATEGELTVALDITITPELKNEGIAREIINRIQNLRKSSDFDVTDKINIQIKCSTVIADAINAFENYIASQTLAQDIEIVNEIGQDSIVIDIDDLKVNVKIEKIRNDVSLY